MTDHTTQHDRTGIRPQHLLAIAIAISLATGACRETPTAPPAERPAFLRAPSTTRPDTVARAVFLPPLGDPAAVARSIVSSDTSRVPTLTLCRLDGAACGTDTLARFTADSTAPDSLRLHTRARTYLARVHLALLGGTPRSVYRAVVSVGDTIAASADFAIASSTTGTPRNDTSTVTVIAPRAHTIVIGFIVLAPPRTLSVKLGDGVGGSPPSGERKIASGTSVPYRFAPDSGYTNVRVTIDGIYAPPAGVIRMDRDHTVLATADPQISVDPRDAGLLRAARAVLRAADKPAAAQRLLDSLAAITDTTDIDARLERVELAAADPTLDASDIAAIDRALSGHIFLVGDGAGIPDTLPPPTPPPGGGGPIILFDRHAPLTTGAPRAATETDGWLNGGGNEEPMVIGYVNGILTTPLRALFASNHLMRLALGAQWRASVPFRVRLAYNSSADRGREKPTPEQRCAAALAELEKRMGLLTQPLFFARCAGIHLRSSASRSAQAILNVAADAAEAAYQYGSVLAAAPPLLADTRRVADSLQVWRALGAHVVMVGHSQGNMMIQEGVRTLDGRGLFHPASDSTCIGAVSLAAPVSTGWPLSDRHIRGLVGRGDPILALRTNHFPRIATRVADSLDRAASRALAERDFIEVIRLRATAPFHLHDVVNGYLRDAVMRDHVQRALVESYWSCAVGTVRVVPQQVHLRPGDRTTLRAALIAGDGAPLDGVRGITWRGESDSDWQRAVTVSPGGTARARYVGGTSVTASTRTRAGMGGVVVDARRIAVAAEERLTYYWTSLGPAVPDMHSTGPASTLPGGPWNGTTCASRTVVETTLYAQVCTAAYDIRVESVPGAALYEATVFPLHETGRGAPVRSSTPYLHTESSGPAPTHGDAGPPPALLDRIAVNAYDAAGHLLASGETCVHGCAGWPPR